MGETLLRLRRIRIADKLDDQHTAAEILNALVSSITEEDLQEFLLSQVKRIIHGDNPGTWRDDFEADGTLSLQELSREFQLAANCMATDAVGDLVYVRTDAAGGVPQVTKIEVTDSSKMPAIAVIIAKSSPTDCRILRYGLHSMPGLIPGKTYFAGLDGTITPTRPASIPGSKVFVQVVGVALDSGRLILNPSFNLTRLI
jgi:hypothetical protein